MRMTFTQTNQKRPFTSQFYKRSKTLIGNFKYSAKIMLKVYDDSNFKYSVKILPKFL